MTPSAITSLQLIDYHDRIVTVRYLDTDGVEHVFCDELSPAEWAVVYNMAYCGYSGENTRVMARALQISECLCVTQPSLQERLHDLAVEMCERREEQTVLYLRGNDVCQYWEGSGIHQPIKHLDKMLEYMADGRDLHFSGSRAKKENGSYWLASTSGSLTVKVKMDLSSMFPARPVEGDCWKLQWSGEKVILTRGSLSLSLPGGLETVQDLYQLDGGNSYQVGETVFRIQNGRLCFQYTEGDNQLSGEVHLPDPLKEKIVC